MNTEAIVTPTAPHFERELAVESSNVKTLAYDPVQGVLQVRFEKSVYHYFGISQPFYAEMLNSPSIGQFLDTRIKKAGLPFKKIEPKAEGE